MNNNYKTQLNMNLLFLATVKNLIKNPLKKTIFLLMLLIKATKKIKKNCRPKKIKVAIINKKLIRNNYKKKLNNNNNQYLK